MYFGWDDILREKYGSPGVYWDKVWRLNEVSYRRQNLQLVQFQDIYPAKSGKTHSRKGRKDHRGCGIFFQLVADAAQCFLS